MTPPIRGDIHVAVEYDTDPEKATLRDLIEWYKKVVRVADMLGTTRPMEIKYIDQAWIHYCSEVAKTQAVPTGALMVFTQELARAEMRALELAEEANAND